MVRDGGAGLFLRRGGMDGTGGEVSNLKVDNEIGVKLDLLSCGVLKYNFTTRVVK